MPLTMLRTDDPRTIGPFQLQGRLGSGGMGEVFLAFDGAGRAVALKTLPRGAGQEARTRLEREADLLAGVRSPRVARCLDVDVTASVPWIAMDYVQGPTVLDAVKPLAEPVVRLLAGGLAEALIALHEQGIVHRDVKPANVILTHGGPVLVDLGIARTQDLTALTRSGTVVGSPGWMAPEQVSGGEITPAVDVWGWGCTLLFAATGRPPFGDGPFEVLAHRIGSGEPDLTGAPPWLVPLLRRALVKGPVARATAADLRTLLEAAAPTALVGAVPAQTAVLRAEAAPTAVAGVVPAPTPVPSTPPSAPAPPRRRAGIGVIAAAVAVLLAGATWLAVTRPWEGRGQGAATSVTGGAVPSVGGTPTPDRTTGTPPARTSAPSTTAPATSVSSPESEAEDASGQGPQWSADDVVIRSVRKQDQRRPDFPDEVVGYTLAGQERATVRVFEEDETWQTLTQFPASMNGCAQQRFYVRWRSLNADADIEAAWLSSDGQAVESKVVRGTAGWQSSSGCSQPGFRVRSIKGPDGLTDVIVEVQRWEASS